MRWVKWCIVCLMAFGLADCAQKNSEERSVPRREGYPRIASEESVYVEVDSLPLVMEFNDKAQLTKRMGADGSVWIDCLYPQLRSTIYFTFTPVNGTTKANVVSNRLDRILLNLGGMEAEIEELENKEGDPVTIFTAQDVVTTPVQFIATTPLWVVSGTVFLADVSSNAPMDSISPIIETLHRDILHSLSSIKYKK